MSEKTDMISALYNGFRTSKEIASIVGLSPRYVRKVAKNLNLERLGPGARTGEDNHQFVSGRRIDLDGYVLVYAPPEHPYARKRLRRPSRLMFEHRKIMEQELGRFLLPSEIVDHKDGLTLHNEPSNLRLFSSNGEHLRETITGYPKLLSVSGRKNLQTKNHPDVNYQRVDTYSLRRARGEIRLLQILLAALQFGIDSPFLLGTHRHLQKVGIDWSSHSKTKLALDELTDRWIKDLAR